MSVTRASLIRGPGKVSNGTATFWSKADIQYKPIAVRNGIECSSFNITDKTLDEARIEIDFEVFGLWQYLTTLFPAWLLNPAKGTRLITGADVPWTVYGHLDQQLLTAFNAALMTPPSLQLGPTADVFGTAKLMGLIADGKNLSDADSLYKIQEGQNDPGGQFAMTNYSRSRWSASWGAIDGFAAFQAAEKWDITFNVNWAAEMCQKMTVNYILQSVEIFAKCKPVGPTASQIRAAHHITDKDSGSRMGDTAGHIPDLVLTSGAKSVTIKGAGLQDAGYRFGSSAEALRADECGWLAVSTMTAGVMNPIFAIA